MIDRFNSNLPFLSVYYVFSPMLGAWCRQMHGKPIA